jgi:hypothetical protein
MAELVEQCTVVPVIQVRIQCDLWIDAHSKLICEICMPYVGFEPTLTWIGLGDLTNLLLYHRVTLLWYIFKECNIKFSSNTNLSLKLFFKVGVVLVVLKLSLSWSQQVPKVNLVFWMFSYHNFIFAVKTLRKGRSTVV